MYNDDREVGIISLTLSIKRKEVNQMAKIDLSKYGITGTTEIVYNPSYEMLFEEETKPTLEGFEKARKVNWVLSTL